MKTKYYSPRLSRDVVKALYHEGQRRRMPMTRLANALIREGLEREQGSINKESDPTQQKDASDQAG